jgi:hypothetical protein
MEIPLGNKEIKSLEAWASSKGGIGGEVNSPLYRDFDYSGRLDNPLYLADIRAYARERGITDKSDAEIDDWLHDSSNYRELNTLGSFFGAAGSQSDLAKHSKGVDSRSRAARIHQAIANAPNFYEEGGRGAAAIPSIVGAVATDPVNWLLGAVEAGSGGVASPAVVGARAAITGGSKLAPAMRGAARAAKFGLVEGAITGGISNVGMQGVEQDLGISDEFSKARFLEETALSGVMSAGFAGLFGAGGGAIAGSRSRKAVQGLLAKGYSEAEIQGILAQGEKGLQFLSEQEPDVFREMMAQQDAPDGATEELSPLQQREQNETYLNETRLASQQQALRGHLEEQRAKLASLRDDNEFGQLDDEINATEETLASLQEAMQFPKSFANRQKVIDQLFQSPEPKDHERARMLQRELLKNEADFAIAVKSGVPEDMNEFIRGRVENAQARETGERIETEAGSLDEAARKAALKERQSIVASEAKKSATAEGVVAKDTGELDARTDATAEGQARLTETPPGAAEADEIISEAKRLENEQIAREKAAAQAEAQAPEAGAAPKAEAAGTAAQDAGPAAAPVADTPVEEPAKLKVPVTRATKSKTVNASSSAKKQAIEMGVDLAEVKGTGQDGRILKSDIMSHVETQGASDSTIESLTFIADTLEDVATKLNQFGATEAQVAQALADPALIRSAFQEYGAGALDDEMLDSLMEIFQNQIDTAKSPANSDYKAPNFNSKSEEKFYNRRVAELLTSGMNEKGAKLAAALDLRNNRMAATPTKVDKTKVDPRLASGTVSSPAGRMDSAMPIKEGPTGRPLERLQSLLRQGRVFKEADGSEYSITDRAPDARFFTFDQAAVRARNALETAERLSKEEVRLGRPMTEKEIASGRSLNAKNEDIGIDNSGVTRSAVQPFIANGSIRVADSKTRPPRGTTLYVSGKNGKAYSDWRNAARNAGMGVDGGMPEPLQALVADLQARNPATRSKKTVAASESMKAGTVKPMVATGASFEDLLRAIAERSNPNSSVAPPTADLPPLSMGGKRLFLVRKTTGEVRAPNDKQIASGATAKNLLGKSSIDEWDVEYHPTSFARTKAGVDQARKAAQSGAKDVVPEVAAVPTRELATTPFTSKFSPDMAASVSELNDALTTGVATGALPTRFGAMTLGENFTGQDLMSLSDYIHKLPFSGANKESFRVLKAVAEIEEIVAPYGIRPPLATRNEALDSINTVFSNLPSDMVTPMRDLVNRLANGEAPRIDLAHPSVPVANFNANEGIVTFNPLVASGKRRTVQPVSFVFYHEVGHWAHLNLLSAKDRAEFWGWAADNLPDNAAALKKLGIDPSAAAEDGARSKADIVAGHFNSPAEFFADMFARWATGQIPSAQNASMWQRFAKYISALFSTIVDRKPVVDPELERLFLKIVPDAEAQRISNDATMADAGTPTVEVAVGTSNPVRAGSDVADLDADLPLISETPNYMELSIDDLLEIGDDSRKSFIIALKDVHDQVDSINDLWGQAEDTLDPELAIEAYRQTQQLLIGRVLNKAEKSSYLATVARAKGEPLQPLYSSSPDAFAPFRYYDQLIGRGKSAMKRLAKARRGTLDIEGDDASFSMASNFISETEALDSGLTSFIDPQKAARTLLQLYRAGDNKGGIDNSISRLLADMKNATNLSFNAAGVLPKNRIDLLPKKELQSLKRMSLGRFKDVSVNDVFVRINKSKGTTVVPPEERGRKWIVDKLEDETAILRDADDGRMIRVTGDGLDTFRRAKDGEAPSSLLKKREDRIAQEKDLIAKLAKERVQRAKRLAVAKLAAMPEPDLPASPLSTSPKAIRTEDLLRRSDSNTTLEPQAIDEVMSRELAKPYIVADGIVAAPLEEANATLKQARRFIMEGDTRVDSAFATLASRNPDAAITPIDPTVNKAIRRELADTHGVSTEPGIPASAPPTVYDLLKSINSRNRRSDVTNRTVAYRLMRLADPASKDIPSLAAFDPASESWKTFRSAVKQFGDQLTGGNIDAPAARLARLILSTDEAFQAQMASRGLDDKDAGRMLDAMLNRKTGNDVPRDAMDLASGLLDRAAYVTNGLIESDVLRDAFARLTYYGDVFKPSQLSTDNAVKPMSNMTAVEALDFGYGTMSPETVGIPADVLARAGYRDLALMSSDGQIVTFPLDHALGQLKQTMSYDDKAVLMHIEMANDLAAKINTASKPSVQKAYREAIQAHLRGIEDLGGPVPRYSVMAVQAKTPFSLKGGLDNEKVVNSFRRGIEDAIEDGDIPEAWSTALSNRMTRLRPGMSNTEVMTILGEIDAPDYTPDKILKALGYDSIVNQFGRIEKVFDGVKVEPIDDLMKPHLFDAPAAFEDGATSRIGQSMTAATSAPAKVFSVPPARDISISADDFSIRSWLSKFERKSFLNRDDQIAPLKMRHKWFGKNSERMRSAGFNTFADFFENHFPAVQQDFARRLMGTISTPGPLSLLRKLPDAPSGLQRWRHSVTSSTPKVESHSKILRALVEPSNPRLVARLTDDERNAMNAIKTATQKAYADLEEAGVMMGYRGPNFFPQIWDKMAIRKNSAQAIEAFKEYYKLEARKQGRAMGDDEATRTATNTVAKLAEVDNQSLWEPNMNKGVSGAAENIDYTRTIELDKHPEALKFMEPFLEKDLESYLVKYFDQVSHRLSLAKKFGHRNHAFGDYMTVTVRGRDGIAKLLSSTKVTEHSTYAITPEDGLVNAVVSESYPMPFVNDEIAAVQAADDVMAIHKSLGPKMAKKYLMDLAVPDVANGGAPSKVYTRRVEAIVDALNDFGGEQQRITTSDQNFLVNAMKTAARRPLHDSNTVGVGAMKGLRAFNSVTLLSYTLLASLGDTMLPVVRSGDFKSSMKAWASYMSDPDYREAMKNIGGSVESLLHNRLTYMSGAPASKAMSAFFNATGLTPWTDEMRSIASAVGLESFKAAQMKTLREFDPAKPIAQQSAVFKRNYRYLQQVGLAEFATRGDSLASKANIESDAVRTAILKFVDTSVFSPNPNDVPMWAQTPFGALIFQLKSFPLMMQRMSKEVLWDDLKVAIADRRGIPLTPDQKGTGNLKRGLALLTIMPVFGMGVNTVMDVVRGRGGEEGTERRPAERSLSKTLVQLPFFREEDDLIDGLRNHEDLDAVVGNLLSGFATTAGLGLIASMITDTAQQAENGAYGAQRMMSVVGGPSVGTAFSAANVVQGILDGNSDSSYPERQAVREAVQRVPILGGQRGARESIVDSIEQLMNFDQKKRKARTQGNGGGFGSGF